MVQKRIVSTGLILTYALINKEFQQQLVKVVPSPVSSWFSNFTFVYGKTPLSEWQWPVVLCLSYLISVYALRKYMENKKPWDLFTVRVIHNAFLCLASLVMMAGCIKETIVIFQHRGLEGLLCDSTGFASTSTNADLWYYLFYVSKFYEFIDTWILVLRRKPLIFLHVFHHFITAILCWAGIAGNLPNQWITLILNTGVHVAMYNYYLISTLGGDVSWKKYLTSAQIVQFIIDLIVIQSYFYFSNFLGLACSGDGRILLFADCILVSFLVLFIKFYSSTYKTGKERSE